jgi:hypothetical protein
LLGGQAVTLLGAANLVDDPIHGQRKRLGGRVVVLGPPIGLSPFHERGDMAVDAATALRQP